MLTAAVLAFGVSPTASAGGGEGIEAKVAKHENGPYVSDGPLAASVAAGNAKNLYLKAKDIDLPPMEVELVQPFDTAAGYGTKYFRNDENITAAVTGDGFGFGLGKKSKTFRVKVRVAEGPAPAPWCLTNQFTVTSPSPDGDVTNIALNGSDCD